MRGRRPATRIPRKGDPDYRADRHEGRAAAVESFAEFDPTPPPMLDGNETALSQWQHLVESVPQAVLKAADTGEAALYCWWYAEVIQLMELQQTEDDWRTAARLRGATELVRKLGAPFGLNPIERQRLRVPEPVVDDEMNKFFEPKVVS